MGSQTRRVTCYFDSAAGELAGAGFDSEAAGFDSVLVSVFDSDFDSGFDSLPLSDLFPSDFVSVFVSPGLPVEPLA